MFDRKFEPDELMPWQEMTGAIKALQEDVTRMKEEYQSVNAALSSLAVRNGVSLHSLRGSLESVALTSLALSSHVGNHENELHSMAERLQGVEYRAQGVESLVNKLMEALNIELVAGMPVEKERMDG